MSYVFQFGTVWRELDHLLLGAWLTLRLSALAMILGLAVGIAGAQATTSSSRLLRGMVQCYVEAIRNTPFLVQLLLIYLGLPSLGLRLTPDQAALLAMVVNLGAYATEIVRAGIEAVPKGHIEAGLSLAMTKWEVLRRIVLNQAFRKIYPALSSQIIIVMLGSSVVSQISAEDLTYAANFVQSRNFRAFEVYVVAAAIYLLLAIIARYILRGVGWLVFPRS